MRHYIRHPSSVPILFSVESGGSARECLHDVSAGGLCFEARIRLEPGTEIHLAIPVRRPPFEADAVVAWCHTTDAGFRVGVRFSGEESVFALRMVEQVCHIEHYRQDVLKREGRELSSEQAAAEWIARYADKFPQAS